MHTIHARPRHVKCCDPAIHALTAVIWHTALLPRAPLSNVSLPGSISCTGRQLVALRSRHTPTAQVATSVAGPRRMPLHSPPPAKAHEDIRGARAVVRLPVADGFWLPFASVGKANVGRWRGSGTRFVPRHGRYPHLEPICGYLGHPTHAKYRSVKTAWPHTWR